MALVHVTTVDNTPEYQAELKKTLQNAMDDLGNDLQSVARGAAPEDTGNLVKNIVINSGYSGGAYQVELESNAIAPEDGFNYAAAMHNGKYNLGAKSRVKGTASSRIGNFRKRVGPNYLQGSGELAKAGYQAYVSQKVSVLNGKYAE